MGYYCGVFKDESDDGLIHISRDGHGICEMHRRKGEKSAKYRYIMDRKEYKEYFSKYYKIPFIAINQNSKNVTVDKKKNEVMEVAIKSLKNWYDNYFELLFKDSTIKEMTNNTFSKTIQSPFARTNNVTLTRTQIAATIINRYFDFLVMTNCPQYADGQIRKRIRKQVYNDFVKGRYFKNQIGEELYNMIEKIAEK